MHARTWNSNTQLTISGLSSHSLSPSFEYGLVGDDASISSRLEFASFSSMPYQLAVIASMYVCNCPLLLSCSEATLRKMTVLVDWYLFVPFEAGGQKFNHVMIENNNC